MFTHVLFKTNLIKFKMYRPKETPNFNRNNHKMAFTHVLSILGINLWQITILTDDLELEILPFELCETLKD